MKTLTDAMVREYCLEFNDDFLRKLFENAMEYDRALVDATIEDFGTEFDDFLEANYGEVNRWEYQ